MEKKQYKYLINKEKGTISQVLPSIDADVKRQLAFRYCIAIYILMDVQYQTYCRYIRPTEKDERLRKIEEYWERNNMQWSKTYYYRLDNTSNIVLSDIIDEFERFLHNEIVSYRMMTADIYRHIINDEKIYGVSSAYICNKFAMLANDFHKKCLRRGNNWIYNCSQAAYRWARVYGGLSKQEISEDKHNKLMLFENTLGKKIAHWFVDPDGIFTKTFFTDK